jgi:hypothetical protein
LKYSEGAKCGIAREGKVVTLGFGEIVLMARVFLSHTSIDKDRFVIPFAKALERLGVSVWLDQEQLRAGDDIVQKIFEEGIGKADAVVVVISPKSLNSAWVQQELNATVVRRLSHDTRLIPVLIDGAEAPVSVAHLLHVKGASSDAAAMAQRVADAIIGDGPRTEPAQNPVTSYTPRIRGMDKVDELLLRFVCEEVLRQRHYPYVSSESFLSFGDQNMISQARLEESLAALSSGSYIEEMHEVGSRLPYAVKPTTFGMGVYLQAFYDELEGAYRKVVAAIVNDGLFSDDQLASSTALPTALVDYILDSLERDGLVVLSRAMDGTYVMPQPTLQRLLR